jgi:hypothetical protein
MKPNAVTALLSRLAGLFLLVAFGAAQVQLMPLITVMAAEVDGGHRVEVCASLSGVHIVLHHPRTAGGGVAPGHVHHGLLCVIAGNDGSTSHPDHEFTFASCSNAVEAKSQSGTGTWTVGIAVEWAEARKPVLLDRIEKAAGPPPAAWWPPPPADCAWGEVVLLI